MEDEIRLPADAHAMGEPVTVAGDRLRRERTPRADRPVPPGDGSSIGLAASDVMSRRLEGADYVAAYRTWLGIEPYPRSRFLSAEGDRG